MKSGKRKISPLVSFFYKYSFIYGRILWRLLRRWHKWCKVSKLFHQKLQSNLKKKKNEICSQIDAGSPCRWLGFSPVSWVRIAKLILEHQGQIEFSWGWSSFYFIHCVCRDQCLIRSRNDQSNVIEIISLKENNSISIRYWIIVIVKIEFNGQCSFCVW